MLTVKITIDDARFEIDGAVNFSDVKPYLTPWLASVLTVDPRPSVILGRLNQITTQLEALEAQGDTLMATAAELNDKLDRIDKSTDKIAADVRNLASQIGTGMTQAEVDAAVAKADVIAGRLEALDAETPDVPPTPPTP